MAEENKEKQVFELRKIYVKDISFESPMAPGIFMQDGATPAVDIQLNVGHGDLGDSMYESIVTVTVTGKLEGKDAFLAEVQQAGVFEISGVDPNKGLVAALEVACPNILFPFAREAINDVVGKGGFPQLLLSPVYFERLYRQKMRQQANNAQDQQDGEAAAESEAGNETA